MNRLQSDELKASEVVQSVSDKREKTLSQWFSSDPNAGEHGGKSLDLFCIMTTYFLSLKRLIMK